MLWRDLIPGLKVEVRDDARVLRFPITDDITKEDWGCGDGYIVCYTPTPETPGAASNSHRFFMGTPIEIGHWKRSEI